MNTSKIGRIGEMKARAFLKFKLYKILECNYKRRTGEIDIIAKKGEYIVFIEVKYRKNLKMGYPLEAVDFKKQERIRKTAMVYLAEKGLECDVRFDCVEILGNKISHIENAF